MRLTVLIPWSFIIPLAVALCAPAQAEQHRATRLGSPATRFAPPLQTPDDLRALFRNEQLKPDIAAILRQWGWTGNLEDLRQAALTNEITEVKIAVGATMPFMSSREAGRPVCLRNVLWAGSEPVSAYAFTFASQGRRYRCVTPRPCSNFYLEDLGTPALVLTCDAPDEAVMGRPVRVCLALRNSGDAAEPNATVSLRFPAGATYVSPASTNVSAPGRLTWRFPNLAPGASKLMCASFLLPQPGSMEFASTATGEQVKPLQSSCSTRIAGIPAILLEVVDLDDPIEIGKEVTYVIRVLNQGSATGTNIRLAVTLPESQEFVSGTGSSAVHAEDRTLSMEPLPTLDPKAEASWRVVVKALRADDARFEVALRTDQFTALITEDEATQQY